MEAKPLTRLEGSSVGIGEPQVEKQAGATIVLRPAIGLTAERLQLVVECHIARNFFDGISALLFSCGADPGTKPTT